MRGEREERERERGERVITVEGNGLISSLTPTDEAAAMTKIRPNLPP